ncbi:fumarylacetoacetate hydrolase family protein [Frigidibacter sp. ROC022]|uniref:fumarylacetoacetate hydrolase family protein n=1 Tax=Frigidibacter sp. ROC022 TaxID=2971796 RepID=UPI00215A33CB|nr:fumarylacetoacetate hydrolase family protein [Frigidibacter sp. ROC022]MCR8723543.1 fumarylacetoacetate hydrolase family protein [Frigidibacter sp. ROC022]
MMRLRFVAPRDAGCPGATGLAEQAREAARILSCTDALCQPEPGDLIGAGTPPGVGAGMTLRQYSNFGRVIRLGIRGLGAQHRNVTPLSEVTQ